MTSGTKVGEPSPEVASDGYASGAGALLMLAAGFGAAAVVDFGQTAGQIGLAGRLVLAFAPWFLALRSWSRRTSGGRRLEGAVPAAWALLLAGALTSVVPQAREGPRSLLFVVVLGVGAALMLVTLRRHGHLTQVGLVLRVGAGLALGGTASALALLQPAGGAVAYAIGDVLLAGHLLPQLAHDLGVVRWGRRTGEAARVRAALEGADMPFLLWTLAGHLIVAPAVLYWSPKPSVLVGGVGAAIALALIAVRGLAGTHPRRLVALVVGVSVVYGVGLALLVRGGRPY